MSASECTEKPEKSGVPTLPVGYTAGAVDTHLFPMMIFLLVWARFQLIRIQDHITKEHAPELQDSNSWYSKELMRLVRHFRLGISLMQKGRWTEPGLTWFRKINTFELMSGNRLLEAGVMDQPPAPGLVDRLKPILADCLHEIDAELPAEVQSRLNFVQNQT